MSAARPAALKVRARHLAGRLVGWAFETAGGPPPGLVPGAGASLDERPVVVVLLLGADSAAVAATAEDLAAAVRAGGPRPVLLLDQPHFAAARRAGIVTDHVLSPEDWAARGYAQDWADYLAGELDRLRRDLRTRHVVRLPAQGSRALDPAALADALQPPGRHARRSAAAARLWQRAVVRLERRIDRTPGG